MKLVIVEDEKLATERLVTLINEYDPTIEILACLESIEETVTWLRQHVHPDLLLVDIHLSDGHSFEIFKQVNFNRPVVFTTAYDQYALDAFKVLSLDYILKPVTLEALATALNRFRSLSASFTNLDLAQLNSAMGSAGYKRRFLGKVGPRLHFIEVSDIGFFHAENKIVYLTDKDGNRYVVEHTLERLELLLDPKEFFRLNRRFIVRIHAIQQVRPHYNNRLRICVKGCNLPAEEMVVSRDRVAEFKQWADT